MTNETQKLTFRRLRPALLAFALGTLITAALSYVLVIQIKLDLRIAALKSMAKQIEAQNSMLSLSSLELTVFSAGIVIAALFAITVYLSQLNKERAQSLRIANETLKKEIQDHLETEESKQKLEKALLQGQKLQAIGTLAGGIAHDFNNILYAIKGYAEITQEDVPKESLAYHNIGKIVSATHRGHDLISRILTFSRRHHHEFKPIYVIEAIQGVLDMLRPTIPATVNILLQYDRHQPIIVMGNLTQLHQVIVNLITNAVDAMDGEGTITLTLDIVPSNPSQIDQFMIDPDLGRCQITVSDTGHGMDEATMERIFEPFFTTKEVGKGTGLGLATVHGIIEEHQGEISVTSELGRGTTFTLLLPLCAKAPQREKEYRDGEYSTS